MNGCSGATCGALTTTEISESPPSQMAVRCATVSPQGKPGHLRCRQQIDQQEVELAPIHLQACQRLMAAYRNLLLQAGTRIVIPRSFGQENPSRPWRTERESLAEASKSEFGAELGHPADKRERSVLSATNQAGAVCRARPVPRPSVYFEIERMLLSGCGYSPKFTEWRPNLRWQQH